MSRPANRSSVPDPIGRVVAGRYRLEREIGTGAMGAVFEARDEKGARVAVKLVSRKWAGQVGAHRFSREASLPSGVTDPHVLPVLEAGEDTELDQLYLVMPLMTGGDLTSTLRRVGPLHPMVAARILLQVCAGVGALHAAGVIHRDIKPSNIFLEPDEHGQLLVRIGDFGIAKKVELYDDSRLTITGTSLGSPLYMAPEQLKSAKHVDERADVWSLGVTLYEMLCGSPPCDGAQLIADLIVAVCGRDAPPVQDRAQWVDPGLAGVVHRALQRNADARWQSVRELRDAVAPYSEGSDALTLEMLEPLPETWRQHVAPRADLRAEHSSSISDGPLGSSEDDALVDKVLDGKYRLLRVLGRGGMGAVYEAEAPDGSRVAVKVITAELAGQKDEQAIRRFVREARAANQLAHPNVVRTLDTGTDAKLGIPFIVMELLDGIPLSTLYRRHGPISPDALVRIFVMAARGLSAAHEAGFIHRDVKPGNIFLQVDRESGEVVAKVCDFGIAKRTIDDGVADQSSHELTRTGGLLGSPLYMSPEQARNAKTVDRRTDIWGLGVSLFQGLTGRHLWEGRETLGEIILAICTEPIPMLQDFAPWVDPALAEVVHRVIARNPGERFQSAGEFADALLPLAGGTTRLHRDDLRGVDEARRSTVAPRSGALAGRPLDSAHGGGSTTAAGAQARSMPVVESSRRRVVMATAGGAVLVALVAAGVLASRASDSARAAASHADQVSLSANVPEAASGQMGAPAAKTFTGLVRVEPRAARVTVGGALVPVEDGAVRLSGNSGDSFDVVVEFEGSQKRERVWLTRDGKLEPSSIALEPPAKPASKGSSRAKQPSAGSLRRPPSQPSLAPAAPAQPPLASETTPARAVIKPKGDWKE